jgi:hypothetical protein
MNPIEGRGDSHAAKRITRKLRKGTQRKLATAAKGSKDRPFTGHGVASRQVV